MLLTPPEAELFFKLHRALMFFVNHQLHVLPHEIKSVDDYAVQAPEARIKVHKAFLDEIDLIEKFIDENPAGLTEDELEIVQSWHHLVAGRFYIFRYLKKYTVFLSSEDQPIAYAVLALTEPFENLVSAYLPVMTETILLPFKGKIIYDGLLNSFNISFGGGMRRSFKESYDEAKKRLGIITSLPLVERAPVAAPRRTKPQKPTHNPFKGRWRITQMDQWDQDFVDEDVEGFFEFDAKDNGSFQFGYVSGDIDYRLVTRDGKPSIEFSWEGQDEMEEAQGRGWAVVDGDKLDGMLFIHHGDHSAFKAKRKK